MTAFTLFTQLLAIIKSILTFIAHNFQSSRLLILKIDKRLYIKMKNVTFQSRIDMKNLTVYQTSQYFSTTL